MLSSDTWQSVNDLIYCIYHSENSVELRTLFLDQIGALLPYDAAFFDLKDTYRGKTFYYDPVSVNVQKDLMSLYYREYADKDYVSWVLTQPEDYMIYRDSDLVSDSARKRSSFYREWMEPQGLAHGCGAIIAYDGIVYGTVTFARKKINSDFSDMDMEVLEAVVRHLCLKFSQLYPAGIPHEKVRKTHADFYNHFHLTEREKELCHLLYTGASPEEISRLLCISIHTVNRHLANIYRKLNVNSRLQLMKEMSLFDNSKI